MVRMTSGLAGSRRQHHPPRRLRGGGVSDFAVAIRRLHRWLAPMLLLFAVAVVAPDVADAQSRRPVPTQPTKRPVPNRVNVEVMVVHATSTEARVDPRLKEIQKLPQFTRFKGFKLLTQQPAQLADGADTTVNVAGNRKLKVHLLSHNATEAKLRIRMLKEGNKILDTTVSVKRNRAFLIAGPKYQGGNLILSFKAEY